MANSNENNSKSNKRTLILVLLVFALPSAAALLMYISGWRPATTQNHGELIQPVRAISDRVMQAIEGKSVKFFDAHGKWTMVYFDTSSCPEECMKQLYFMRQIHNSQGKNLDRIQRIFIASDADGFATLKGKLADYPGMHVWSTSQIELIKLKQEFGLIDISGSQPERNIYLLDPQGNLMMRYMPGVEPAGMRKDLERLLKYSADNPA